MTQPVLTRSSHRETQRPLLPFLGDLCLELARAHEVCGNARRFLALMIAAKMQGPVFWIAPGWQNDRLNPQAVSRLINPGRITFLEPQRADDLLWCLEDVLRAGSVPLVVADLPAPPGLTPVRRLHLAAQTGAGSGQGPGPLGLLLTPGQGGAQGIETRWHITTQHAPGGIRAWQLDRRRARTAPPQSWRVQPEADGFKALQINSVST